MSKATDLEIKQISKSLMEKWNRYKELETKHHFRIKNDYITKFDIRKRIKLLSNKIKLFVKSRKKGLNFRKINIIHFANNKLYLTAGIRDDYNVCYYADKEYTKSINNSDIGMVEYADGVNEQVLFCSEYSPENFKLNNPDIDKSLKEKLNNITLARERLIRDYVSRGILELDANQLSSMKLFLIFIFLSGIGIGAMIMAYLI